MFIVSVCDVDFSKKTIRFVGPSLRAIALILKKRLSDLYVR